MNKFFGNKLTICIFALPGLILFTIFVFYPLLPEVLMSLQRNDGFKSLGYVGLSNYIDVLKNATFWKANVNNLIMVFVSTLIGVPISFLLAFVLDTQMHGAFRRFFKISAFLPSVLSVTVICQMWKAIYEPQWGVLNQILKIFGLGNDSRSLLTDPHAAIWAVTVAFLWQFLGFNMVIIYAGMKGVPKEYYEAGQLDGATGVRAAFSITLPLIQDIMKYVMVISILGCMAQFAHINLMTDGGPGDSSRTVVFQIIYTAIGSGDFGRGSAMAIVFVVECLIITVLINRFVARERLEY